MSIPAPLLFFHKAYQIFFTTLFSKITGDPYRILFHQTARPSNLHPAVEDIMFRDARVLIISVDHIDALVLRQRAETVIPLHTVGPVGLLRGLVAAMKIFAEAQAASNRLQTAIYHRR